MMKATRKFRIEYSGIGNLVRKRCNERLVSASDEVGVGVVIRSVDLFKLGSSEKSVLILLIPLKTPSLKIN